MLWITLVFTLLVIVSSWLYTAAITNTKFPRFRNKKICLLIAHPDDEAMFFAPTLLALTRPELGNHVKILCLSSGDAEGLGEIRKKELAKSALILGLRKEEDVFIVESPDFPDSATMTWSKENITTLLCKAFIPNPPSSANTAPTAIIDALITFDAEGISSHPNHISLYHGARHFISTLLRNRPGWKSPIDLYTLTSINVVRKYSTFFDSIVSLADVGFQKKSMGNLPSPLLFMSGPRDLRTAQTAMTTAHVSQMKWFRWGWVGFSRYMVINDLRLEKVS